MSLGSDPRFAPGPTDLPPGKRGGLSGGCLLALILGVLGFTGMVVCGGALGYLMKVGFDQLAAEVRAEFANHPVLVERLGEIQSVETDFLGSIANEDDEEFVYRLRGTQGSGMLIVVQTTLSDGTEAYHRVTLRLPSGEEIEIPTTSPPEEEF